jgi:hypothetical protein
LKSECEAVDRELIAIAFLLVFISDHEERIGRRRTVIHST